MPNINDLQTIYKMKIPISEGGILWNGCPDKWSNLPAWRLLMSQRFGMRPDIYKQFGLAGHNGLDIAGRKGAPITAPFRLWIKYVRNIADGYGRQVWAETDAKTINGQTTKLEMVFGHFDKIAAKAYRWYETGELLGAMGNTGFVFGPTGVHLHFGVRPLYKIKNGNWGQMFYNNGFNGWVDPEPFIDIKIIWDYRDCMDKDKIQLFLQTYDTRLVRNNKTGEIGWVYDTKLRTIKKWGEIPRSLMLTLTYLHRRDGGAAVDDNFWNELPKVNF